MKKLILFILPFWLFAQNGIKVEYEVKQEFDKSKLKKLSVKSLEILQNSESKRYYYELFVNKDNSNFVKIERINNEQVKRAAISSLSITGTNIYKDFVTNELYEQNDMKPKLFVKDSIQHFPWVLSKEESTILGYKVRKATYTNPTQSVEAWYTTELPFRDGPSSFNGLPGLILRVSFKLPFVSDMDTNVSFTAIDVKPYEGKIELPNKSKKVTKDEFEKEMEKSSFKFNGIRCTGVERD
ncbi:GLPGLI family protein [Chishuiella sp.]|uniref:GLPGLI family protein n=1 Tax=Chishuiella sp. TaxID=1969467 RepID=UPI0028ADC921|nr:GLPGLI family protein [Chishuiella sp.]